MDQFKIPTNLEVRHINNKIGYGVFTTSNIKMGDVVEICYCLEFKNEINNFIDYTYTHSTTKKTLLALGYGSIYNHSYDNNLAWRIIEGNNKLIEFYSTRDIETGEELCLNYGKAYWSKRTLI
jgi:SET domain-containing protein